MQTVKFDTVQTLKLESTHRAPIDGATLTAADGSDDKLIGEATVVDVLAEFDVTVVVNMADLVNDYNNILVEQIATEAKQWKLTGNIQQNNISSGGSN